MPEVRNTPEWLNGVKNAFTELVAQVKEHDEFVTTVEESDKGELVKSMDYIKDVLNAKDASDSGTEELYGQINDLAGYIREDVYDCIKELRASKLVKSTISDWYFNEGVTRWRISEKKTWIKRKKTIAFVGAFNAGKSSIINLILSNGDRKLKILSVDNTPTTAVPTYISYGEKDSYRFFSLDEKLKEISKKTFRYINSKDEIEKIGSLSSLVKYFVMTCAAPQLQSISILDTPGFSSNDKEDERRTISVINECDALFWVIDCEMGVINGSSLNTLKNNLINTPLYIIINKVDLKAESDVNMIEEKVECVLKENKINCQKIIRFSVKESDYKEILNIISRIEHHDDQDGFLDNLLSELENDSKELKVKVNELSNCCDKQAKLIINSRQEYENLKQGVSEQFHVPNDLYEIKFPLIGNPSVRMTLTQFDSFKNHLSSFVESKIEKMNSLLNEISKAEKDLERNNREHDDANHLLRKLNKCIKKLQISVNNQK